MRSRRGVVVIAALLAGLLAGCRDGGAGDPGEDLEATVEAFGRAFLTGDVERLYELVDPASGAVPTDEELEAAQSFAVPGRDVELRDFAFEILEQDATSAEATYSGTQCAPQTINSSSGFGGSGFGGSGAGDSGSIVPDSLPGETELGEVECHDIAEGLADWPPFTFTKVDGRWYGAIPGI